MNADIRVLFAIATLTAATGCLHTDPSSPPDPLVCESSAAITDDRRNHEDAGVPDENAQGVPDELLKVDMAEYKLGPGDVIEVFAHGIPEVSRTYTVGPDGCITLP
ncbi:MAG: polysaccharide biosynthesis/export family protein, partial [Kiritimatiellales bacterium]|nr:polysaccharide biosynthesis/export family protein [Kiritimatiellales bacterium]